MTDTPTSGNKRTVKATTPDPRTVQLAVLGLALIFMLFSAPWSTAGVFGFVVIVAWSSFSALLVGWLLREGSVATAVIVTAVVLAYSQGLGDAIEEGLLVAGFHASPEGVFGAAVGVLCYLLLAAVVSRLISRVVARRTDRLERSGSPTFMALLVFLMTCFIAALGTGAWSFWGGGGGLEADSGLFRLELFYAPTLAVTACFAILHHLENVHPVKRTGVHHRAPFDWKTWGVGLALALMLFALQSRRLMALVGLLFAFSIVVATPAGNLRRVLIRASGLVLVLLVFSMGSAGWREHGQDTSVSVAGRVEGALEAVGDTRGFDQIESRFTYLWFDATASDLRNTNIQLEASDLLLSNLARAVPRALLPSKDEIPSVTCETGLEGLSLPADLPCTPTSEAFLWAGFFGILFAGLLTGLVLGTAELCIRSGGAWRIVGFYLVIPSVMLESGLFGFVGGIRLALIGTAFVALIALVFSLLGWGRAASGPISPRTVTRRE